MHGVGSHKTHSDLSCLMADTVDLGSSCAQANPCHKAAVPAQLTETRSRSHCSRLTVETRPANESHAASLPCHACHRADEMQLLDQPRVRHAAGSLASVPTCICICNDGRRVCAHARAPTPTHDKRLGTGVRLWLGWL
jgi:hypothetical protein